MGHYNRFHMLHLQLRQDGLNRAGLLVAEIRAPALDGLS